MITLADKAILSGADNHLPMLEKDMYDLWKSIMELYIMNRQHGRMILEFVKNGPLLWPTVEENGLTRPKKYSELSAMEAIQADCDVKATNIILQGLTQESSQYGSPYQSSKYRSHAQTSTPLLITYPSNDFQSSVHHNVYNPSSSIPQVEYASLVHQQSDFSQPDTSLVVPVFQKGDDPIDDVNRMMSFLTAVVTLRYPLTNNKLRNSSNPRQQATINNGRVTIKPIQRRQNSLTTGHMSKQCTKPKRKMDEAWFKDKVLLVQAQANRQVLYEEELEFLADPEIAEAQSTHDSNIIPYSQYVNESQYAAVQNSSFHAQHDALILYMIEQLKTQVVNCTKINQNNKSVNQILTPELERYKDQVRILKEGNNVNNVSVSCAPSLEIDNLKHTLSEHLKEKESLEQIVTLLKNDFQKEESRNIDRELALEKQIKELNNIMFKRNQSTQTVHMLTKPQFFYDHSTRQAISYQNPCYLKKAQQLKPKLYDGSVIQKTNAIAIRDYEETLMLEDEKPNLPTRPTIVEVPKELSKVSMMEQAVEQHYVDKNRFQDKMKDVLKENERLLEQAIITDIVNIVVNANVNYACETVNECERYVTLETELQSLQEKALVITALKDTLSKLKGKAVVDEAVTLHSIDPELLRIDVAPLAPKLRNNRIALYDYLKLTSLDYACKYTKRIQELLIILKQTCPCINDLGNKLMAVTPVNNNKKIRFTEHITSSRNTPIKTTFSSNVVSNKPMLSSTGVNLPTSASGLQPPVKFDNDHIAKIMGYGDYNIGNVTISKVYFVEGLGHNLFSVGRFCDSDFEVAFRQHTCFIRNLEGVDLLTGSRGNNLYTLSLGDMMASSPICLLSKASKTKSWLWHRRLSHLNFGAINHLARQGLVRGLPKVKFKKDHLCSACEMGKSKKQSHKPKSEDTNQEKLYFLHMDLCGPMRGENVNEKNYILVIVDDYSRFTWVKCLRSKDEAPDFIIKFLKII
nr:retrovirus-related Pol polyprotein from transposon TNT 1-94 [Tanacetum cinerariifolium]